MAPRLENPVQEMPGQFEAATLIVRDGQPYWWQGFGDPHLNQLVDSVIVRNLDVRIAMMRVAQLQSQFRIARAGQLPSMELDVRREQLDTPSNTGIGGQLQEQVNIPGGPEFPERFEYTTYSASLKFAYELDFWGRVSGKKRAALQELLATQADVRTALIGVISETISTYFEIAEHMQALALMHEGVDILRERAGITVERYERGLVSSFELYAVEHELGGSQAEIPIRESQLEAARGRLALLLGRFDIASDSILIPETVHTFVLEEIPSGLPSDLLRERPDVVAAFQRLEAARERIGVARAARFPSFLLTGAAGTQSNLLSEIVKTGQNFWLFGAGLTAPIFNANTIRANIRRAWAEYEQLAAQYQKTVLTAFRDVEAALVSYGKIKEQHAFLAASREAASESARHQERRYVRGLGDYLGYLDARYNLVKSERVLSASRRSLAEARLAVHRSLGGAWVEQSDQ